MSEAAEFLDGGSEGRGGRAPAPWDAIHQWVALSGVSARAIALYEVYRMHINDRRGDSKAWPGVIVLSELLGVRTDRITALNAELVGIGAIEIERRRMPRKNIYTVHQLPPPGYTGPTSLAAWYKINAARIEQRKDGRDAVVKRSRAKTTLAETSSQTPPATPVSGLQEELGHKPSATPVSGSLATPVSGSLATPVSGSELNELELPEVKLNPPLPPRDPQTETSAPVQAEPGGGFSQDGQDWTERDQKGAEVLGDLLTAFQSEQPRAERVAPQGYDDDGGYDDDRLDDSLMGSSPEDVAATVVGSLSELVPAMPELSFGDRARVRTAVVATLRRGVSLDVVLRELERKTPDDVQGWGRFLVARLERIGTSYHAGRPPHCGSCDPTTRILMTVIRDEQGYERERAARCPRCHPLTVTYA